ncbi:Ppx/GppA phosphatase family-domain-containing protein [Umbelopsis sp. PMI_123]|nr:Ppx/GppA phosphatase family-domain-containing protein [Umbelopsis sp. PMI_123]
MSLTIPPVEAPFGVVDMGSNGIRFGIVQSLARNLPVLYEERAPISLFDAQSSDKVIPEDVIEEVITSFLRFKAICDQAGVAPDNVRLIATEATRIAENSEQFQKRIFEATGWKTILLRKEEEALVSAMGIVGSFDHVSGLALDLGGGSVELNYLIRDSTTSNTEQGFSSSKNAVSLPYGAAALKKFLKNQDNETERERFATQLTAELTEALEKIEVPETIQAQCDQDGGYTIYLSGGGFRALGYMCMADSKLSGFESKYDHLYPVPIINGYSISGKTLTKLAKKYVDRSPDELVKELKVFRISKRRATMIPACSFLVLALLNVIKVRTVYFSEGGVRQGVCFSMLSLEEKSKDPAIEGIKQYAEASLYALREDQFNGLYSKVLRAIPPSYLEPDHPLQLHRLLPCAIYLSNLSSHYPKESRATIAFHMPLSGGQLSNIPGLLHHHRAVLSLILTHRQGGEVAEPLYKDIVHLIGKKEAAVCMYVGRVMEYYYALSPLNPGIGLDDIGVDIFPVYKEYNGEEFPSTEIVVSMPQHANPMVDAPSVSSVLANILKIAKQSAFKEEPSLFSVNLIRKVD